MQLAVVSCPTSSCRITNAAATVLVRGRAFWGRAIYSKKEFGPNDKVVIRVEISKNAYKRLLNRKSGVVRVAVTAQGEKASSVTRTIGAGIRR